MPTIQPRVTLVAVLAGLLAALALACGGVSPKPQGEGGSGGANEGPGHRSQALGLTPAQERDLGKQAYQEVLAKSRKSTDERVVHKVREIGGAIARAANIEPLQREINLHVQGYTFEWEFNVFDDKQVNAFCLPGGKVAVFSGLIPVVSDRGEINDSMLATVMAHEVSHALAHHASERVARAQKNEWAMKALGGALGALPENERKMLVGLLGAGAQAHSLAYDRQQESEADHIGLFLMTFAGYDPRQAIPFWERMEKISAQHGKPPEILSDHPSDARRIAQIRQWAPAALAANAAFNAGRVAPSRGR